MLKKTKIFLAFKFSNIIFIMLINVRMLTIVGIFDIYEPDKLTCSDGLHVSMKKVL